MVMSRGTSAGRGGCQGPDHLGCESSTPRPAGPTSTRLRRKGESPEATARRDQHQGQKPLSVVITAGRVGDTPHFEPALETIWMPRPGISRLHERPDWVPGPQGVRLPQQSRRPAQTRDQGHNLGPDRPRPLRGNRAACSPQRVAVTSTFTTDPSAKMSARATRS